MTLFSFLCEPFLLKSHTLGGKSGTHLYDVQNHVLIETVQDTFGNTVVTPGPVNQ